VAAAWNVQSKEQHRNLWKPYQSLLATNPLALIHLVFTIKKEITEAGRIAGDVNKQWQYVACRWSLRSELGNHPTTG
jgi:hypothetical protein